MFHIMFPMISWCRKKYLLFPNKIGHPKPSCEIWPIPQSNGCVVQWSKSLWKSPRPVTSKARAIDPPETQQAPDKRPCPWLKGSQHREVVKRSDDDADDDDADDDDADDDDD